MVTTYTTVEVWVLVDADGDYEAGKDSAQAAERYEAEYGADLERGTRMVKLTVKVPLPAPIELTGEVTADETAAGLKVA